MSVWAVEPFLLQNVVREIEMFHQAEVNQAQSARDFHEAELFKALRDALEAAGAIVVLPSFGARQAGATFQAGDRVRSIDANFPGTVLATFGSAVWVDWDRGYLHPGPGTTSALGLRKES